MTYSENILFQIDSQMQLFEKEIGQKADEQLGRFISDKDWNAAECIEHLNLTLSFYLPLIQKGISKARNIGQAPSENYNPGFITERLIRMMRPKDGAIRMQVRTFKRYDPASQNLSPQPVLEQFRTYMNDMKQLTRESQLVHLGKVRIRSSMGPILKIKLGDSFPFLLAHNERHLLQAKRAL